MNSNDIEARVKNIDERTQRIEQILPTLATKDDLRGFPSRDDPKGFATKDDLKAFPTREEVQTAIRQEGERTRQHFNAVAERIEASVKVIAEGHEATKDHVSAEINGVKAELAGHDQRIMKLEAESLKRR
jgi:hypothetical protein